MSKLNCLAAKRLGDYIGQRTLRNSDLQYGADLIEGVNNSGVFCRSKACTDGINLSPYKIVQHGDFVYNPSRLNLGSLAYRTGKMCIVSHLYVVFYLTEYGKKYILPEYLLIFFRRNEFYRLVNYRNFGSQRPEFNFKKLSDIPIYIPSIEEQEKIVAAWKSLRAMKEQNEAMSEPLFALCRSRLQEMQKVYSKVILGDYIVQSDIRNSENTYTVDAVMGISIEKKFIRTKADMTGVSLAPYKIIPPGYFGFVTVTSRNGEKISLAYNESNGTYIVSSSYEVFQVTKKEELLPDFLFLVFQQKEFDRYARFNSWGSARETFSFDEMCRVKIPLPPLAVQKALVDIYRCAAEAKRIAEEADRLSREICPALLQHAVRGDN